MRYFSRSELFAQFIYNLDLSYNELHEKEEELIASLETILAKHHATFIHYEPMGDILFLQCEITQHTEELCHSICNDLAPHIHTFVKARLLFVKKDLEHLSVYTIVDSVWQNAMIKVPSFSS